MAMIICKDCKKEISSEANKCPHCGAKTEKGEMQMRRIVVLILLVGFLIFIRIVHEKTNEDKRKSWGDLAKVTITSEPEYCIEYK